MAQKGWLTLRQAAMIESIESDVRIEGSTLPDREVEQLLGLLYMQAFTSRDEREVAGDDAVKKLEF